MRRGFAALLIAVMLAMAGCAAQASNDQGAQTTNGGASSDGPRGEVTVLAAASLTEVFSKLGKDLEDANPGLKIRFSFGPSSGLAEQIISGAPADVFAAANTKTMDQIVDVGNAVGEPRVFVANTLQIAVPEGNPAGVKGLADFGRKDLRLALCAPEVPCGTASTKVFEAAGITPQPDTLETDVKATLAKVVLGEVDAALVYRTDINLAGRKVQGIDFPEVDRAVNRYPIVALTDGPNPDGAQAFLDMVASDAGREALADAGFVVL